MKFFLRVLAVFYFFGGLLHLADLFDLRLRFSEMSPVWKAWITVLCVFDLGAAIGLWLGRVWGVALFLFVAASQIFVYLEFVSIFGDETSLVTFHLMSVGLYALLWKRSARSV